MKRFSSVIVALSGAWAVTTGCGSDDKSGGGSGGDGPDAGMGATAGVGGSSGGTGATGAAAGTAGSGATGGNGAVGGGGIGGMGAVGGLGTGGERNPDVVGGSCDVASECFPTVDHSTLSGAVTCLTEVEGGYCTHECETDADCCGNDAGVDCRTTLRQVCAPFQARGTKYCFVACEDDDLTAPPDAGTTLADGAPLDLNATEFCQREAHSDFICRSTGGGAENRRACLPEGAPVDGGPEPDAGPPPPPPDGGPEPDASMDASTGTGGDASMGDASMDASDSG